MDVREKAQIIIMWSGLVGIVAMVMYGVIWN